MSLNVPMLSSQRSGDDTKRLETSLDSLISLDKGTLRFMELLKFLGLKLD